MIAILSPFACILLIACIDANGKGRMMAKYAWPDLPQFWKDAGVVAWRSVLALILVAMTVGLWYHFGWQQAVSLVILGACGVESVLYWWVLPLFRIEQPAHWKAFEKVRVELTKRELKKLKKSPNWEIIGDVRPGDTYVKKAQPIVGWFEYPHKASWLYVLPPFMLLAKDKYDVDKDLVYSVALSGVFIELVLTVGLR